MRTLLTLGRHTLAGLRVLLLATLVLGVGYPLGITLVVKVALPWQAAGSLVTADGARTTTYDDAAGSALLGQRFTGRAWFHGRPSAGGYDPLATGGSNLGPESPGLLAQVAARRAAVAAREGVPASVVPPDAVTASASGLDPDISPAYADLQINRVAVATGLSVAELRGLVAAHSTGRTLGVLGEPRVDVLGLNLALARTAG